MLDIFTLKRQVIRWFSDEPKPVTPADLDGMNIHELFAVCNSDAAHVEVEPGDLIPDVWQIGDAVIFGSKQWFEGVPEIEF